METINFQILNTTCTYFLKYNFKKFLTLIYVYKVIMYNCKCRTL